MSSFLNRLKIALGSANAEPGAVATALADPRFSIEDGRTLAIRPAGEAQPVGIIFYHGGRCDPLAYLQLFGELAAAGYPVYLPRMPLRLAVLGANRAADIMATNPDISSWIIGGHSMGGAMAGGLASKHQAELAGVFFIGSYIASMYAMPDSMLPALVVNGSRDFLLQQGELAACPARLPAHAEFVTLEGGDHYGFGHFTGVESEFTATITPAEQQQRTAEILFARIAAWTR